MKKLLSLMIITALILSTFTLVSGAEVLDKEDFIAEGNNTVILWDSVRKNDEIQGNDGFAIDYLDAHDMTVAGPAESVGVVGWAGATQEIVAFGYMVDGGEPVLSADFMSETGDDVRGAAQSMGCDFASRYHITASTEGVEGTHRYTFLCQVEDGSVFIMSTAQAIVVEFDYRAEGEAPTAEPTAEPEEGDKSLEPGPFFRFDEDEKYVEGGLFGAANNIDSIEFDAEKKCYVIHMENASDPWVVMQFTLAMMEDDNYIVDAETYKYMQLGVRLDNPSAGTVGQIYFATDENPGFSEPQGIMMRCEETTDLQFVNVNLGKNKRWTGIMVDTRLDPLGESNGIADYEVYYIAFFQNEKAANDFGAKWLELGDEAIPTPAPTPTKAPTPEPTATPESDATAIPTPVPTDNEPAGQPTADNSGKDDKSNTGDKDTNSKPWLIPVIIGGVVVVAAAVIAIIVSKKKKK